MAEKRMLSKTIIDSDLFLDMPLTAQALYFHLSLRADDEGFINSPKKIMRITGTRDDDLKILIAKKFIIPFESGVVVIKHWLIHNTLRKNRIKHTFHKLEKEQLSLDNNVYTLEKSGEYCLTSDSHMVDKCQHRLDKIRIDKNRINNKESENKKQFSDDSYEIKLTVLLYDLMNQNIKSKKPNFQTWAKHIDLMIRLDKREIQDIKTVIEYSQNDSFWKSNIRSTAKLREKFDTLYLQMTSNKTNKKEMATDENDGYADIYNMF